MKITKSILKQIIKEELEAEMGNAPEEKNSPGLSNGDKYKEKAQELIKKATKKAKLQFTYPTDEDVIKLKKALEEIGKEDGVDYHADVWRTYNGTGYGFVFDGEWKEFIDAPDRGFEEN